MTQQLNHRQIAWRVAQDLPQGTHVLLGGGMPQLVPGYVADRGGIVFESDERMRETRARGEPYDARIFDYYVVGAREVSQAGDLVEHAAARQDASVAKSFVHTGIPRVLVMAEYFAPDGRPTLVPQCSGQPGCARCVTTLYTDLAVLDLREGKAWLREIVEGITLHVLQAETDVPLHVAPGLRLLHAPDLR